MNDVDVLELLGRHDPAAVEQPSLDPDSVEQMWQRLVAGIEDGARPSVRPPASREMKLVRSAVAAVIVLALVAAGVFVAARGSAPSGRHYVALEPLAYSGDANPVPAAPTLDRLAAVAAAAPSKGAGSWYYVETAAWSMFSGAGPADLPVGVPAVGERWIGPDGVERVVSHRDLPVPKSGLKAWFDAGMPLSGGKASDITARATVRFPAVLSSDPADIERQLLDAELGTNHSGGPPRQAELLTAVKDLRAERWITPREQSALLAMLARQPDLISLGTAVDRLGRPVDAIAFDSAYSGLPTRYVLLFDPGTGTLLGSEDILTKTAGKLSVPIPSVISYMIYVRDGHVDDDTSLP